MLAGRASGVHAGRQALPIEVGQVRLCKPLGQGLARRPLGELEPFEGTRPTGALGRRHGSRRATADHPTPHSSQRTARVNAGTGQNRGTRQANGTWTHGRSARVCSSPTTPSRLQSEPGERRTRTALSHPFAAGRGRPGPGQSNVPSGPGAGYRSKVESRPAAARFSTGCPQLVPAEDGLPPGHGRQQPARQAKNCTNR